MVERARDRETEGMWKWERERFRSYQLGFRVEVVEDLR